LVAATAVVERLADGGRHLLDVAMVDVAAHLAGPTLGVPAGTAAAAPRRRNPRGVAPALGADDAEVAQRWGLRLSRS
jgi:hypothetical protein